MRLGCKYQHLTHGGGCACHSPQAQQLIARLGAGLSRRSILKAIAASLAAPALGVVSSASIGMTIPVVAALAVFTGMPLTLGLQPSSIVLLLLTMFVSTLTLGTGRTTTLHGAIHLGIFVMFLLISATP